MKFLALNLLFLSSCSYMSGTQNVIPEPLYGKLTPLPDPGPGLRPVHGDDFTAAKRYRRQIKAFITNVHKSCSMALRAQLPVDYAFRKEVHEDNAIYVDAHALIQQEKYHEGLRRAYKDYVDECRGKP